MALFVFIEKGDSNGSPMLLGLVNSLFFPQLIIIRLLKSHSKKDISFEFSSSAINTSFDVNDLRGREKYIKIRGKRALALGIIPNPRYRNTTSKITCF